MQAQGFKSNDTAQTSKSSHKKAKAGPTTSGKAKKRADVTSTAADSIEKEDLVQERKIKTERQPLEALTEGGEVDNSTNEIGNVDEVEKTEKKRSTRKGKGKATAPKKSTAAKRKAVDLPDNATVSKRTRTSSWGNRIPSIMSRMF